MVSRSSIAASHRDPDVIDVVDTVSVPRRCNNENSLARVIMDDGSPARQCPILADRDTLWRSRSARQHHDLEMVENVRWATRTHRILWDKFTTSHATQSYSYQHFCSRRSLLRNLITSQMTAGNRDDQSRKIKTMTFVRMRDGSFELSVRDWRIDALLCPFYAFCLSSRTRANLVFLVSRV